MEPFWKTCCSSHTTQYSLSVGMRCSAYFMICGAGCGSQPRGGSGGLATRVPYAWEMFGTTARDHSRSQPLLCGDVGQWGDALGSRMGTRVTRDRGDNALGAGPGPSGTQGVHLDEEAVLQRGDILAVATNLRQSPSSASCVILSPHTPCRIGRPRSPRVPPAPSRGDTAAPGTCHPP